MFAISDVFVSNSHLHEMFFPRVRYLKEFDFLKPPATVKIIEYFKMREREYDELIVVTYDIHITPISSYYSITCFSF